MHTFHMSDGDITITLLDVTYIIGLQVDGMTVIGTSVKIDVMYGITC